MASNLNLDETEFAGAMTVRFCTLDISDYETGGEAVVPNDVGMNRFQSVFADITDGTGALAQYDESAATVKLLRQGNDGGGSGNDALVEASGSSGVGAEVSLVLIGK